MESQAPKKHLGVPVDIKKLIVKLKLEGKSYGEISATVDRPRATIQSVVKTFEKNRTFIMAKRRGRKKFVNQYTERIIHVERMVKAGPKIGAPKIAANLEETGGPVVNPQTIRNFLKSKGYKGCVSSRKPFISTKNAKKRLEYAKTYVDKPDDFWNDVIFMDESKYNIFGSDGRRFVWRKANTALRKENLTPTVKHGGGNVMVWGTMAASGVGNLAFVESTMDRFKYLSILKDNLKQSAEKLGLGSDFRVVQDNDPKHSSEVIRTYLLYNCKSVLPHPPQSPDLNPIEHLWDILEKKIRKHTIKNKEQLKRIIEEEWQNISPDETKKLVCSMKSRLKGVIETNGYHTSY